MVCHAAEGEAEVSPVVGKAASLSGDAERLAGGSAHEKVNCWYVPFMIFGHVAEIGNVREPLGEYGGREGFNFGKGYGFPSQGFPRHGCGLNAGADGEAFHLPSFLGSQLQKFSR